MPTRIASVVLIVTFAAAGALTSVPAAAQAKASADHQANVALVQTWRERFLARDFDGLAALYAEDAVLMPPNEPSINGRARIRKWYDGAPSVGSFDPTIDEVEVRGDLAVVRGTFSMTFTPKGATSPSKDNGKWLEVRKKQADGSWKIAVDISSSNLPAK